MKSKLSAFLALFFASTIAWSAGVYTPNNYNPANVTITGGTIGGTPVAGVAAAGAGTPYNPASVAITGGTIGAAVTGATATIGNSSTALATTAFVNPGGSNAANGWTQLPSGLIFEWGYASLTTTTTTVTFPHPFPNAAFVVTLGQVGSYGSEVTAKSKTNFTIVIPGATQTYWMAIGN